MPQPDILKITEIFPSIQGEGLRQGEATLFVRLSECNLKCIFCDTKYAWNKGKNFTTEQVLEKIRKLRRLFPTEWVCLTGGEPLLHDLRKLVNGLKREKFKIQVETNGTIFQPLPVDWYTISPKPERYFFKPEYRKKAKEVKLIVTRELDFEVIRRLRKEFPTETPIILQPQSNRKWSMKAALKLMRQALLAGLKNMRVSVQLHKIYGLR